jgi:hypothetical protein
MISRVCILLILLWECAYGLHSYKDFVREPFKINPEEGVYEVDIGIDNSVQSQLIGVGDFNGDK